jgi:hypothetical protein
MQRFGAYAPEPVIIANVTGERVKRPWDQGTPGVASSVNHLPIFQIRPLPFVVNFRLMQVAAQSPIPRLSHLAGSGQTPVPPTRGRTV